MCLAQGHNTVTPVRLDSVAPLSRVKHSTTEPQCSQIVYSKTCVKWQLSKTENWFLKTNYRHCAPIAESIATWISYQTSMGCNRGGVNLNPSQATYFHTDYALPTGDSSMAKPFVSNL